MYLERQIGGIDYIELHCDGKYCTNWQRVTADESGQQRLLFAGWIVDNGKHFCPYCRKDRQTQNVK